MKNIFASTSKKQTPNCRGQEGIILPIILVISLILGVIFTTTSISAWLGLRGTARQSLAREARETAEAGLAELKESLNRSFAHLLIIDSDQWSDPPFFSSVCSNSEGGMPDTSGDITGRGRYILESYTFNGSPFYGGKAEFRMRGEMTAGGDTTKAAAIVTETVDIKPKCCTTGYGEACNTSGFPGLLGMNDVDMGGNDLKGRLSGNLFCLNCTESIDNTCSVDSTTPLSDYTEADKICVIGGNTNQTEVDGEIVLSPIDLPPVPTPPTSMASLYTNPPDITSSETIEGGSGSGNLLNGACQIDDKGVTHCVVGKIDLSGSDKLTVDTSNGPVRIYVTGDSVDFKGSSGIVHNPSTSQASDFGFFGRPADPDDLYTDQTVILRGSASTNNMWAYFPDGNLGIKGGAGDDVNCDSLGECTGGDISGSVWGKNWGESNGTGAAITVPKDMGQQLFNAFGAQYGIGLRDYVALGVSKWSSHIINDAIETETPVNQENTTQAQ